MEKLFTVEKLQEIRDFNLKKEGFQPLVVESLIESFDLTEDEAKAKAQAYWSV